MPNLDGLVFTFFMINFEFSMSAVSTIKKAGLKIKRVIELTPVPFNGCRPPKKRRK